MDVLYSFKIKELPPPKKNKYRMGNKCMWFDKKVGAAIDRCTETLKRQWKGKGPVIDHLHIHTEITKPGKYPDDIGMLETVYDCLQAAGVVRNDNQFSSWSGWSKIDPNLPECIKVHLGPKGEVG